MQKTGDTKAAFNHDIVDKNRKVKARPKITLKEPKINDEIK